MLLKFNYSTKLILVISVSLLVKIAAASGGTKGGAAPSRLTTSGTSAQKFQVSTAFSTSSEPSVQPVLNYGDRISGRSASGTTGSVTTGQTIVTQSAGTSSTNGFREALRSKSQLVLGDSSSPATGTVGGSVPTGLVTGSLATGNAVPLIASNYGGSIYQQSLSSVRGIVPEEALNLDASSETSGEVVQKQVQQTTGSQTSSEEFLSNLGTEATSVSPIFAEEFNTQAAPVALPVASLPVTFGQARSNTQIEQIEQEHELIPSHKPAQRIQAAVKTKHTFEFRPVVLESLQEEIQPKIIEVGAKSIPLEIHFKSASSRIKLVQQHKSGELQQVERTSSSEEPQRLVHLVRKPIIQEVREIITPYRRIVQEIQPVMEEIHTIVSHEKERSKTSAKQQQGLVKPPVAQKKILAQAQAQVQQPKRPIPQSWLRPSPQPVEQTIQPSRVQSQASQGYGPGFQTFPLEVTSQRPVFNTYPLEVTSPSPLRPQQPEDIPEESSEPENGIDSQDQSVDQINNNDLSSTIIPARLMQEILHDYQTRNRILTVNSRNSVVEPSRVQLPVVSRERVIQQQRERDNRLQTKGGLSQAASNQQWQAVRPYVFYGAQNGQFRGPFGYNNQNNRF